MNIVLLDDNYVIRFVLKKLLPKVLPGSKFNIYSSNNGVEGLGYIFLTRPHLVIVDTTLPKYDGLEVIDYIKNNNHLNNTNVPILILHESDTFDGPFPGKFVVNKSRPDFIEKLLEAVTLRLNLHKGESDFIFNLQKKLGQNVIHFANRSDHTLFTISDKKPSKIENIILTLKSFFFQILSSFYLTLFFILSGKKDNEQNIEQKSRDKFHFRVRFFPAFGAILATILFACFQFSTVFSIPGIFFFSQTTKVEAVTRTWDGGGVDNNWSTCANWSGNVCPGSLDDVVFNATSTKNATINAGFTGTVNSVSINAGYTGVITQARNLVVTSAFSQSAGTFTGSANTLDINGSLTINTGVTFTASTTMTVAGSMTINAAATFNHNSGTITFDGAIVANIICGGKTFNLAAFTGSTTKTVASDCTFPLGNNPTVSAPIQLDGILSGTGTLNSTNAFTLQGTGSISGFTGFSNSGALGSLIINATVDWSTLTLLDLNGTGSSFVTNTFANFTPPTNMSTFSFNYSGGVFNHNNGTVTFDRSSSTGIITCLAAPTPFFNVVFTNTTSISVTSSCTSIPVGASPTIPGPLAIGSTLLGSGTITFNGAITTSGNLPISGFSSVIFNSTMQVTGGNPDYSALTTFDSNSTSGSAIIVTTGTFIAPTGNMSAAGGILIQSTGNWNANGGTLTLDSPSGNKNISCLAGAETLNVIFAHTGTFDISAACTVNVGNNATISNPLWIRGTIQGTGTLTVDNISGNAANWQYYSTAGTGLSGFDELIILNNGPIDTIFAAYSGSILDLSPMTSVTVYGELRGWGGSNITASTDIYLYGILNLVDGSTTFNHNNGTIHILGSDTGGAVCSGGQDVNLGVLNFTGTKSISCFFDIAAPNPVSNGYLQIYGTGGINSTGRFTANADLELDSSIHPLVGMTELVVNGNLTMDISANNHDYSGFTLFDVNGDFVHNQSGSVIAPNLMTVEGNLTSGTTNSGFNANNGTILLDGSNQTISSHATYHNLTKSIVSADTLTFSSATNRVPKFTGTLTLQGASGNLLSLRSSTPGNYAEIYPIGGRNVSYLDVQDIANQHPVEIETIGFNITDSGNNYGWDFSNTSYLPASYPAYVGSAWDNNFYTIDLVTGSTSTTTPITLAGETVEGTNGLDYDPYTCTLYAILKLQGQPGRELVTINPATAVATSVGNTTKNFSAIAFDYYGNLWGVTGDGDATNPETLFTIDKTNATITLETVLGNGGGGEALAFNPTNGLLYHLSGVFGSDAIFETINPQTLAITNIPTTDVVSDEGTSLHYMVNEGKFAMGLNDSNNELSRITTSGVAATYLNLSGSIAPKGIVSTGCTQLVPPEEPGALAPTNLLDGSSTTDITPQFTFNLTDSNSGENVGFRIQIDDSADFNSPVVDYTSALGPQGTFTFTVGQALGGGTYTVGSDGQTLVPGEYYLRILAVDASGQESSYVTANSGNVAFRVIEVDSLEIGISSNTATVGQSLSITVTAKKPDNTTETGYTGTVTFSSTDTSAVVPSNYTFSLSDSGEHSFLNQLVFNSAGNYTVTVTDISDNSLTATSTEVIVSPAPEGEEPVEENCAVNAFTVNCQQRVSISNVVIKPNAENGTIEICWETNIETRAYIEFGLESDGIYSQSTEITDTYSTSHCITISGVVAGIDYIYKLHSISYAGKEEIYIYDPEPGNRSCIEQGENELSFNNNEEVAVSYDTVANARCTLTYQIKDIETISPETPLSTSHESIVDFQEADGLTDILYTIECDIENEKFNIKCDLPGVITAAEYRNFLKPEEPVNSETLFDVLIRILSEIAKNILPITLLTGLVIATAATIASDPRAIVNGYAWLKLRKKSHPWGIVYDLLTSKPISFATVRLYDKEGKFIKEDITGLDGKYGFTVKAGSYKIDISHGDYEILKQNLSINDSRSLITKDFGLESKSDFVTKLRLKIKKNLGKINSIIFLGGFVLSVIATIFSFTPVNLGLTLLYGSNILVLRAFRTNFKPGGVVDNKTNLPIKGAFIRIYDQREKRQTDVQITDEIGSYGFKLEPGSYLVNVYAQGYELDTSKFSNDKIKELEGQKLVETRVGENQNLNIKFSMNKISEDTTSNPFG